MESRGNRAISFGCGRCYGDDPEAAWANTSELERIRRLVDDSHFILQLLRCGVCGQHFLWITTEIVDWAGGDDAQFRRVVPLTPDEARGLARAAGEIDHEELAPLGRDRRYLQVDWPTGQAAPVAVWATGDIEFVGAVER